MTPVVIRRATRDDLRALGRLGALLMRAHFEFDPQRFMAPHPDAEAGYGWFLGTQISDPESVVLVAESGGQVVGYVYARLEPQSWEALREACGYIHDVAVDPSARRSGVATALVRDAMAWLRDHGAPRVVLATAERNDAARQMFLRLGFRRTMIEMTHEL